MTVLSIIIAAVFFFTDFFIKRYILANISVGETFGSFTPLIDFTYVQNTGAAFSSFQGMQWLFALVFAAFTVGIIWEFSKKRMPFTTLERWLIVAIYAGGLGNMIDRVRLGYVVDMIAVDFMNFPVFNVADCFITCGCILLLLHLVFFNRAFWKEEKK